MWDDGSLLNGTALNLNSTEPVRTYEDTFALHYHTNTITGYDEYHHFGCMCQANFDNLTNY